MIPEFEKETLSVQMFVFCCSLMRQCRTSAEFNAISDDLWHQNVPKAKKQCMSNSNWSIVRQPPSTDVSLPPTSTHSWLHSIKNAAVETKEKAEKWCSIEHKRLRLSIAIWDILLKVESQVVFKILFISISRNTADSYTSSKTSSNTYVSRSSGKSTMELI